MTPDQLRLLAELDDWQLVAIADAPDYWCDYIRNCHGCGSVRGDWPSGYWRQTYPWGVAITTPGDYCTERKLADPAHLVTLTWKQIRTWAEALPAELRTEARLVRSSRPPDPDEQHHVAGLLLAGAAPEPLELTLW